MNTVCVKPKPSQVYSNAISFLSSNILYLLEKNGLTQLELAKQIGISHQTLSKFISQESPPPLKRLIEIAEVLGVSTDALLYHNLQLEYDNISYEEDVAPDILRPVEIPECVLRRYRNHNWYMYYYTIRDDEPRLCEAQITTENDINMRYIKAAITTDFHKHSIKVVIDYPRYVYLYGTNAQNPTRFFIMFPDPDYTISCPDLLGCLAICVSVIPENSHGLPGMQFVALSANKLDFCKYESKIIEFLTVPGRRRMLRLHPEQNKKYVEWLQETSSI